MNDTEIRERLRDVTRAPANAPDLRLVERRARVLRWRRAGAVVVSAAIAIAAIAIPLSGLQRLGEGVTSPSPAAEPATGDGRIGFRDAAGWNSLRANDTSVCVATAPFTDADVQTYADSVPEELGCYGDTLRSLPADGALVMAWVMYGRYRWAEPNANFPEASLPLTFDRGCLVDHWEGQPDPDVPQCTIMRTVANRAIEVRVYFGTQSPSEHQLSDAQAEVARLYVDAPASLGADVAFEPLDGWTTSTSTAPAFSPFGEPATAATIANVSLPPPDPASLYPSGLTNDQLKDLPADGIAIVAQQLLFTRNPIPPGSGYRSATLPLDLADARFANGPFEGLDREDVTSSTLDATVNGRPIIAQAWFGTSDPSDDLVRRAQRALDQLVVVPAAPSTDEIDDVGVSMSLPAGWRGLLYSYGDGIANLVASTSTVDLDMERTRASLGPDDAGIVMQESDALVELEGWAPLEGPVSIDTSNLCEGCEMLDDGQPPPDGHVLYQDTFTAGGRAFDVFVEFGSPPTQAGIDAVNAVLGTLSIQPIVDASYTPAPGTTRVGPIYDGEDKPEVTADQQDRGLTWVYEHAKMTLPMGWTGQSYPVVGLERPISLLAAGSWDFTPGGYCGPINALRELPADGALVWFDGYRTDPPDGMAFAPQPSSVSLTGAAMDPSPCFGGSTPFVFRWKIGDRYIVAHAALGTDASSETVADAEEALESISVG